MHLTGDFHTHTTLSHGKGSIMDNVRHANELGLKSIAITDHGPGHMICGIKRENFVRLKEEVELARAEFPHMNIYTGVEVNIVDLDGTLDITDKDLEFFDVILMGYHEMVGAKSLKMAGLITANLAGRLLNIKGARSRQANTKAFIKAIERYPIDAITHIGCKLEVDEYEIAKAAAQNNTLIEINTKHISDASPLLNTFETDCSYLISSDAHHPTSVGMVQQALDFAKEHNISPERLANVNKDYIPKKFR